MEATNPKTAQQMFDHLAGIEGGGSLYTLKRPTPFTVEYTEPISRSSKPDPDTSRNRLFVYLSSSGGKKYRIATDCAEDRCAMEHNPEQVGRPTRRISPDSATAHQATPTTGSRGYTRVRTAVYQ
jgi:hypothetical protein